MIGFTFCGKHSYRDFGLHVKTRSRSTLASRRKRQVEIPGRDGVYTFDGETYDVKVVELTCSVEASSIADFRAKMRRIAAWLQQSGELSFDDEPGISCRAKVYNSMAPEEYLPGGTVPIVFECHPIASGAQHTIALEITKRGNQITVPYDGTAPAPCLVQIYNAGDTAVNGIRIIMTGGVHDA
jgi:predicted phage tail component-like protein